MYSIKSKQYLSPDWWGPLKTDFFKLAIWSFIQQNICSEYKGFSKSVFNRLVNDSGFGDMSKVERWQFFKKNDISTF